MGRRRVRQALVAMVLAVAVLDAAACASNETVRVGVPDTQDSTIAGASITATSETPTPTTTPIATPFRGPPSGPSATPTATLRVIVPPGWTSFTKGGFFGATPTGWQVFVFTADEYLRLVKAGIGQTDLAAAAAKVLDAATSADISATVLYAFAPGGFPNVNVLPCQKGVVPVKVADGPVFAVAYGSALGVPIELAGEVEVNGERFAVLKLTVTKGVDAFQAYVGTSECATVITVGAQAGDANAREIFRKFAAVLAVK